MTPSWSNSAVHSPIFSEVCTLLCGVVGLDVVGELVGAAVTGAAVTGALVTGAEVTGADVIGAVVVDASVTTSTVAVPMPAPAPLHSIMAMFVAVTSSQVMEPVAAAPHTTVPLTPNAVAVPTARQSVTAIVCATGLAFQHIQLAVVTPVYATAALT